MTAEEFRRALLDWTNEQMRAQDRLGRLEVDFRNVPRGTRVRAEPGGVDLDVTAGYAMAH